MSCLVVCYRDEISKIEVLTEKYRVGLSLFDSDKKGIREKVIERKAYESK